MKIHVVQKDETLWKIAQKYGVDFDQLIAANQQLADPNMIMPGMKIKIPASTNKQQSDKQQQTPPKKEMTQTQEDKSSDKKKPTNQILPEIKEDEEKKWEPLKKELPSLPMNFNKQPSEKEPKLQPMVPQMNQQKLQQMPQQQQPSNDLKWLQFTSNNFETNIQQPMHPVSEKPQQQPEQPSLTKPVQQQQMPHMIPQAPCYSTDGIPYGYGHMQPMPYQGGYPFPDNFNPQQMPQNQMMPQMQQQMPQNQMMPQMQQQMPQEQMMPQMQQQMPQEQMMPQMQQQWTAQPMWPQMLPGGPQQGWQQPLMNPQQLHVPQPGAPGYPMVPLPPQGFGMGGNMYPNYQGPQHPYGKQQNDCGCGRREE
ncbi:SafA/ExsA family spore coat assembly protein [Gracilibacillus marinus]|uniref:SafA/ExsA family spore coat assembly protein n=1 Tax=Gracilibacillus marinus TaxID=630535 RepID=A0ABV8VV31_9BACI